MAISFRQVKKFMSDDIDPDTIEYTDENGIVWTVPSMHRFWIEIYEPWLAAGNAPLPA
ncbi:Uncharacterised protein [Burkholderia pseudomallei]|uniref:hypothetical protein n=1 Tax=Burkholderia pseudomallei TaxID=28450 RepID=UPI000F1E15AE|nr:hypothetical protein [Burkholderia pseudomallei]MCW0102603.1 hypothetical protein [Burkholderia pseudomallei]CAJ2907567.1 Uncharacterised protein [Burkholderia pseudomallei]VCG48073.1 Uncharacterised protein [Burkholderia pseudomallei]VCG67281.1 Uncharacterised protein [Burkholderia pseudomallei]VCG69586.1 Uncharacterised protein [Burkholderia pseudomallei]